MAREKRRGGGKGSRVGLSMRGIGSVYLSVLRMRLRWNP